MGFIFEKAVEFLVGKLSDDYKNQKEVISHGRKAMRKLAASLAETVAYLEDGLHRLERVKGNPAQFSVALADLVSQEHLNRNCKEAGVCEDLRVAQDELQKLPQTLRSMEGRLVDTLIRDIDGYEREFVRHIGQFLSESRSLDISLSGSNPVPDPSAALEGLKERVAALRQVAEKIENASDILRAPTMPI